MNVLIIGTNPENVKRLETALKNVHTNLCAATLCDMHDEIPDVVDAIFWAPEGSEMLVKVFISSDRIYMTNWPINEIPNKFKDNKDI